MSIRSTYIKVFEWKQFLEIVSNDATLSTLINDTDFRILKIVNVSLNITNLTEELCNERVKYLLTNSSHLFFLIIESVDDLDLYEFDQWFLDIFSSSKKVNFLIEFCSKTIVTFILNGRKVERLPIENLSKTDEEEYEQKVSLINSLIIRTGDQSLCKLNVLLPEYQNLFNDESYHVDSVGVRLLKTLDDNEEVDKEFDKNILKKLVSQSSVHVIRAYLNLSIADDGSPSIRPTKLTSNAISYKYDNEQTLLSIAASGDLDVLKLLSRLGANIQAEDKNQKTASDYAFSASNFENLLFLLQSDARFPCQLSFGSEIEYGTGCKQEIRRLCQNRDEFHRSIEDGNAEGIKSFRKKYPSLKFGYKLINDYPGWRAATTTAILKASFNEDYNTYFLLLDEGFRSNDFEIAELKLKKSIKSKMNLLWLSELRRKSNSNICRFLLSMTKIAYATVEEHETHLIKIKEIYRQLNGIKDVKHILPVLEYSKSLIINFDFSNRTILGMDLKARKGDDGITYHYLGHIYVSAASKTDDEIASVVIHELTHFAMHIVFNNACKPYYKSDKIREINYQEIVRNIKRKGKDNHLNIQKVFKYDKSDFEKELIVRVPELIVLGQGQVLMETYTELFKFFLDSTLHFVKKVTDKPDEFFIKREVEQLNEALGHIEEIEKRNIWTEVSCIVRQPNSSDDGHFIPDIGINNIFDPNANHKNIKLIVCNTPRLFLADFYKFIIRSNLISSFDPDKHCDRKDHFIVATFEDFNSSLRIQYIRRVWNLSPDITLLLNCENFDETLLKKCKFLNGEDIPGKVFAFGSQEKILRKILTNKEIKCFPVEYKWKNIDKPSREKLLMSEISFQGANVQLNKLIIDDFEHIPFEKLISGESISIETSKIAIDNYDHDKFVQRSFAEYENVEKLLSSTKDKLVSLFLSDEAGAGKSVLLSHIALRLKDTQYCPEYWLTRINLHEHVDAFEDNNIDDPLEFASKYFAKTDISSDKEFQQELFKRLYDNGRMILLLDGLDEIAPKLTKKICFLIKALNKRIQLWITTRPNLRKDLEKVCPEAISLELNPFSMTDQQECATRYWQKQLLLFDAINERKLRDFALKIMRQFRVTIEDQGWTSNIGAPLLTTMVAEYHLKAVEENVRMNSDTFEDAEYSDIFQLYKDFTLKKILIVYREKGMLIAKEEAENKFISRDIFAIFERLALRFIFPIDSIRGESNSYIYHDRHFNDGMFLIDIDNMQRCGFISIASNGEPYFIHRSFAEFFVANFVVKSLKNTSKTSRDKFNVSMEILCKLIINIDGFNDYTIIKFINEGMKDLGNETNEDEILSSGATYLIEKKFMLRNNRLSEEIENYNSFFILHFFIKCLSRCKKVETTKIIFNIFELASKKCVRSVVEYIYELAAEDLDSTRKYILNKHKLSNLSASHFNAFQFTFMNFPQGDVDVVKDTTDFENLKGALSRKNKFGETLRKPVEEKYANSTLKLHVNKANKYLESGDEKDLFLVYEDFDIDRFDYCHISEQHFEDSMEMKWMAMNDLNWHTTDFEYLGSKTLFENIVKIIFQTPQNNKIILKFYEWAKVKSENNSTFKNFVEETFVKYVCYYVTDEDGIQEILNFVRSEIDLENVLERRSHDIISILCREHMTLNFKEIFQLCESNFTCEEFKILLFQNSPNSQHDNHLVSLFLRSAQITTEQIGTLYMEFADSNFVTFLKVISTKEEILSKMREYTALNEMDNLNVWLRYVVTNRFLNKLEVSNMMNGIKTIFHPQQLRKALIQTSHYETLFHLASKIPHIFLMQILWKMAKESLTPDELESLLFTPANCFCIIKNVSSKKYLEEPPSIYNTYCSSASFEFVPYKFGDGIPTYAVPVDAEKSIYIGRTTNEDVLCQIVIKPTQIQVITIGYFDFPETDRSNTEIEILVGIGLNWELSEIMKFRALNKYFFFDRKFLVKDERNSVSLVDNHSNQYTLVFDDPYYTDSDKDFIYCKK